MQTFFDSAFGIHERALAVRSQRAQILASNMANADTPNFKARDIDFREVLEGESGGTMTLAATHPGHMPASNSSLMGPLKYRIPFNPALDGNTVEMDTEQAEFTSNAVQYQATLTFLNGRIRGLREAITGGR